MEPDLPLIWYPWFDATEAQIDEAGARERKSKVGVRVFGAKSTDCVVNAGDKIVIDRVEKKQIGDRFEHSHDSEIRLVYLKVIRKSGECKHIGDPLVFRGSYSILSSSNKLCIVENIQERICDHFRLKSIRSKKKIKNDYLYAYRALEQARELNALVDSEVDRYRGGYINDAALLGYLWAKAEAEINLKPLAKQALQVKENSQAGGKNSGEVRRKLAEDGWKAIAKAMAVEIRREYPDASQDKVAEEIRLDWRPKKPRCPQHPTLKKFISDLERSEQLPKRKKPTRTYEAAPEAENFAA
jgi:hypothetical protein